MSTFSIICIFAAGFALGFATFGFAVTRVASLRQFIRDNFDKEA